MTLALGAIIGSQVFPNGDTATGGQGSPVDGIPCDSATITYHIHSHVTLFHNGTQVAFPIAVGLLNPVYTMGGNYASAGTCSYHLHTHDNSGIVHVENDGVTAFTLGQLFDIWGMPLSMNNVAGFTGPMISYVGTSLYAGDPRAIVFSQHEQITLEVGGPYVYPPFYTWSY
jgi:hypothetical protein